MTHTIQFDRMLLHQTQEDGWDRLTYDQDQTFFSGDTGLPELPAVAVHLVIPSDASVASVSIVSIKDNVLPYKYQIYPTQPPVPAGMTSDPAQFVDPDPTVYDASTIYPQSPVRILSEGSFDGATQIVTLLVTPLEYLPTDGQLSFIDEVSFELTFTKRTTPALVPTQRLAKDQAIYDNILQQMVDNPEQLSNYQVKPTLKSGLGKISSGPLPAYEYVVITSDALKPDFKPFVSWKIRQGVDIGIVTTEEINTYYSTDYTSGITDEAGAVRQYLTDSYNDGTVWVLLGGDDTVVPTRYGYALSNTSNWYYIIPTDLYYAELNGDWNGDSDGYYGEPTVDFAEFDPELYVGRIAVSTSAEVETWFRKTQQYTDYPNKGDYGYLTDALLTQEDQMQWNYDEATQISNLLTGYFTSTIMEEDIKCGTPSYPLGSDLVDEIDNGYGLVSFHAHGSQTAIGTSTGIGNTTCSYTQSPWRSLRESWTSNGGVSGVNYLAENHKFYFLYTEGCETAAYDYNRNPLPGGDQSINRTLMEAFMEEPHKGAVTYVGNTRYGWVGTSFTLEKKFFNNLLNDNTAGVAYTLSKTQITGDKRYLNYSNNYFGDPQLKVWLQTPSEISNASVTDNGTNIAVNTGVTGADITVTSGDNGATYNLTASNTSLYTFATSVRPLYVTITKPGYAPYNAVTGGTFTTDEIWIGQLHALNTVVMDNNSTLTVLPGASLNVAESKNLSIRAGSKIVAEGTVQDSIYFTAESGSAQHPWGTFYLSGSHNRLKYCVLEYGDWGLKIYNANGATDNIIENSDLRFNDQGIRIERNEVVAKNNTIHDNRHGIVTINNTEVEFHGNHIYNNDRDGIYSTTNNYLQLYGNIIEDNGQGGTNTRNGIYTVNGDNVEVGDVNGIIWAGYNTIRNNVATEIYAGYGDPVVEIIEASIHDNSGDEVYNYTGNPTIIDYTTWWGESPPNSSQIVGDVTVHSPKSSAPVWEGTTQSTGYLPKSETTDHPTPPTPAVIAHLKQLIQNNIGSPRADSALVRLNFYVRHDYHTNALNERGQYSAFLNQLYTGRPQTAEGQRALQYLIAWQMVNNHLSEALGLTQIALDNSSATQRPPLAEKMFYLQVYTGDLEAAQATLAEFPATTAAQTATREFLTDYLAEAQAAAAQDEALAKKAAPTEDTPALPTTVVLRPNYPNPFNPTTTIVYAVPTAQHVQIEVFDMQGHLVQTLLNKQVPAGYHAVDWNGTNQTGTSVASGLYLYRLRTPSAIRVKKMMLIR